MKLKPGRANLQRVADGVDRQRLRRRSHGRPRRAGRPAPRRPAEPVLPPDPDPGIRRPIVKMARRLSVFSGKPTTKNAGPAWNPKPVETRTLRSLFSSQTEPTSRNSASPGVAVFDRRVDHAVAARRRDVVLVPAAKRPRVAEREALEERRVAGDAPGHAGRLHVVPAQSRIGTSPARGTSCRPDRFRARGTRRARRSWPRRGASHRRSSFHRWSKSIDATAAFAICDAGAGTERLQLGDAHARGDAEIRAEGELQQRRDRRSRVVYGRGTSGLNVSASSVGVRQSWSNQDHSRLAPSRRVPSFRVSNRSP